MIRQIYRSLVSIVFAVLLVQLAGFGALVQAASSATRCQDLIPNTSYRYSDALMYFTSFNNKTYAISKSAALGAGPAANYFAMDAGITYEYSMGGPDNNSIKYKVNSGYFGTARPVAIPDQTTLDFVLKRFGRFLSTSSTANSTYIDGWKDYGASAVTTISGQPFPFPNYGVDPATVVGPKAMVMGSGGLFNFTDQGIRTSQIVEFDGKMDCAVDYTPVTPPVTCPGGQIVVKGICQCPTGKALISGTCQDPPPGYLKDRVCGQDLNKDGNIDPILETSSCYTTPQGEFCPVGAVNCEPTNNPPMCPPGSSLNINRDMCQADPVVNCPSGYTWDKSIDRCVAAIVCPDGGSYNSSRQRCEKAGGLQCPNGYVMDSANGICTMTPTCPDNGIFSASANRCELIAKWDCVSGFTYNTVTMRCEKAPQCDNGTAFNPSTDRCETTPSACPANYTYDATVGKCVSSATCLTGNLNSNTDLCETPGTPVCPSGWTLNGNRCEQPPSCQAPGAYDPANDLCVTPITEAVCASGYTYDAASKTCVQSPTCQSPGSFANGHCESTPVCPNGAVFNTALARCEAAPNSCPAGFQFSTTLDRCVAQVSCPNGGSLNGSTNMCEIQSGLTCISGWTLNQSTGKCEQTPTCSSPGSFDLALASCVASTTSILCPANYTFNSTLGVCVENPACPSGFTYNAQLGKCEGAPVCAGGSTFNQSTGRCEKAISACPAGYSFNTVLDKCVATVPCSGSTYNPTSDSCEVSGTPTCAAGNYNAATGYCEQSPTCPAPGVFNAILHVCTSTTTTCPSSYTYDSVLGVCTSPCPGGACTCPAPGSYNSSIGSCTASTSASTCTDGYSFNSTLGLCTLSPSCPAGTTFNPSNNNCEAPYSLTCPTPGYSLNVGSGRCEYQPPTCSAGTYNATYNKCLLEANPYCPTGYAYNVTRSRCEKQPPVCPSGGNYNASLDKCERTATSPANCTSCAGGYTWNGSVCVKSYPAVLTGGANYDVPVRVSWDFECSNVSFTLGPVYGYASSSSPVGPQILQIPAAYSGDVNVCVGPSGCPPTATWGFGPPVPKGYISTSQVTAGFVPFYGMEPACGYSMWNGSSFGGPELNGIIGYLAPSPGAFGGTYQCPQGGALSGTTCTSTAAPVCQNYAATATGGAVFDVPVYRNPSAPYREALLYSSSSNAPSLYGYVARPSSTGNGLLPMYDGDVDYFIKTANAPHLVGYASNTDPGGWIKLFQDDYLNLEVLWRLDSGVVADFGYIAPTPQTIGVTYTCPNGGTLSGTLCIFGESTCTDGSTPINGICQENPTCPGGNFDPVSDTCWTSYTPTCPNGMTYDTGIGYCYANPTCNSGQLDPAVDVCFQAASANCPAGATLSGGVCVANLSCVGGGTYNSSAGACTYSPSYACPTGYTYNSTAGSCVQNPVCSSGTFDQVTNTCRSNSTLTCPNGYTLNGANCQIAPLCPNGGALNGMTDLCEAAGSVCANGFSLDGLADVCYSTASCASGVLTGNVCQITAGCDAGGTLNQSQGLCTGNATFNCPSGYNYSAGAGKCVSAADCGTGGLNIATGICEMSHGLSCPASYILNGTACQLPPDCGNAAYDQDQKLCVSGSSPCVSGTMLDGIADICIATPTCASGYGLTGSICVSTASCGPGGSLDLAGGVCRGNATFNCPSGYSYSPVSGQCFVAATCSSGSLDVSADVCQTTYSLNCPNGYTLSGNTCVAGPTCAGGVYNPTIDKCEAANQFCSSPLLFDQTAAVCYETAKCGSGSLDTQNDVCSSAATPNCSSTSNSYTYDPATSTCSAQPVCVPGSYDSQLHVCKTTITNSCGTYTFDPVVGACSQAVICPTDPQFSLASTIAYAPSIDSCASDADHQCVTGTTYTGLPILTCEAAPICDGAVKYDPTVHACYVGNNTCPLGSQYTCMINPSGVSQCSANQCVDANSLTTGDETKLDDKMYQDDGPRDAQGNCLGKVLIFNGKPSRCRPPGITVGYINNCCESDTIVPEDVGNNIQNAYSTLQTLYDLGTIAYYTYEMSTGAMTMAEVGEALYDAGAAVMEAVGAAMEAVATGVELAGAMADAVMAYCSALIASPAIIIGIVVMVIMKVVMGKGCDKTDIQTSSGIASKQCHYIGDYCEKKSFLGCMQKAKGYCCFNSKIARIIHEQGRPQLKHFQPDGNWGRPEQGNCEGFTPEEFSQLNFSTIDLSEYFDDVTKDLDQKVQGAKSKAEQQIQQRFNAIK